MKYTEEMILHSSSGYCMPFDEPSKEVEISLGYGQQKHPLTGEDFFHHGVDFNVNHYLLSAVATGTVSAIGSDETHGIYQTIRYGKYEVTYRHLSNVFANFSQTVKAGQTVAISGNMLHVDVRFDGEELDPIEFLTMLYANIKATERENEELITLDMTIPSPYDVDRKEIETLMMRFLPLYFNDLQHGVYNLPEHTERSLRNVFTQAASRHYFFETMPSMANPLGIGTRSMPLAAKVQNLLIADFLNYLALRHETYLSSVSEDVKKVHAEAIANSGIIDPLAELDIDIQSFDIPRVVSVYPDRAGVRWWTKAWFNGKELGEPSVEIEERMAIQFILGMIDKDQWLEEHFPKQMEIYHNAIEQTKEQLINQIKIIG